MSEKPVTLLLWAYVINLGIAFGAGLYESRIEVPRWFSADAGPDGSPRWHREAAAAADVGLRFWVFVSTVPLTLLTLAGLACLWRAPEPVRTWWLVAVAAGLAERAMTFGYFIPAMIRLLDPALYGGAEAAAKAALWVKLGWLRHGANAVSLAAALQAFAAWYARSPR